MLSIINYNRLTQIDVRNGLRIYKSIKKKNSG